MPNHFRCRYSISGSSLTLQCGRSSLTIDLEACNRNYHRSSPAQTDNRPKYVSVRDVTALTYVFSSDPPTEFSFRGTGLLPAGRIRLFINLQRLLNQHGYTTFDLS